MKTVKEILFIGFFSVAIAIAYNYTLPKPLSLIREKQEIVAVDDNLLFSTDTNALKKKYDADLNSDISQKTQTTPELNETVDQKTKAKDSLLASANIDDTKKDKQKVVEAHQNLGKSVTYEQMLKIVNNDSFIIIDARNPENYAKERIGNSINIFPYGDEGEMMNKIMSLPFDKTIVVYCDGGACDASHKIAEIIITFGYEKVFIYSGGWEEWALKYKKTK